MASRTALDPVAEHNRRFWDRWARAGGEYTRPRGRLPRSRPAVRRLLDPRDRLAGVELEGARALALAAGGGWDAVALARLGAHTVLVDLSARQLRTVREAARVLDPGERRRLRIEQGDMRDLSRFPDASFDLVWHCGSLVFVDDAERVLAEVGRVLRPRGTYVTATMHPATMRLYGTWDGGWHPRPYFGDPRTPVDPWVLGDREYGATIEFGHRIETLVNGLARAGMVVDGLWELRRTDLEGGRPPRRPEPGSPEHLESLFPTYVELRARKLPWPPGRG